jgi:ribosomal protein S1
MSNNDLIDVSIKWIDNRKGLFCIIFNNGNTKLVHRKEIIKPEKKSELKKLKKGDVITIKIFNINIDEWCVL